MNKIKEAPFRMRKDEETGLWEVLGEIEGRRVMGMGEHLKDAIEAAFRMAYPDMKGVELPDNWAFDNPITNYEQEYGEGDEPTE